MSRSAVWKHVDELRSMGYQIDSAPRKGYLLVEPADRLLEEEISVDLNARVIGHTIHSYQSVGSTNDVARDLARDGAPEGIVVLAEEQTRGRGRLGREWESPSGGVYMSIILRPRLKPDEAPRLTLTAAVAVARALGDLGVDAMIKWPNDVHVGGRKIAGVLTEMSAEVDRVNHVILGIGVNVNDCPEGATCVNEELGGVRRVRVAASILGELDRAYGGDWQECLEEWRRLSNTLGRRVRVATFNEVIEGVAVDVDRNGALVLDLGDRRERVLTGDCFHLR